MWSERFGIGKVPLNGNAGLIFGLSAMTILVIGIPPVRWFFACSAGLGLLIAFFFWLARRMGIWH